MKAEITELKQEIARADAVIIGAGAGLSTAAGFVYSGERFEKYFADFGQKYGFRDMYSGGFYPYETKEEFWAYWSRYIWINRYMDAPKETYRNLFHLVKDKDCFVLTTNVDHCFQKAGFDKKRLFYTQGDYGLFQCSKPCCAKTWDNEETIRKRLAVYHSQTAPLIEWYEKEGLHRHINGLGTLDRIFADICQVVSGEKPSASERGQGTSASMR